jgi:copper/silver efflux system protein
MSGTSAKVNAKRGGVIGFCLDNGLIVLLLVLFAVGAGLVVAPFPWDLPILPRNPVPVDAIPDLGENQQIILTEWPGRSPQDIEDQVTYPLTVSLMGLPHVKTVRSYSYFGFSTVYVLFKENIEFYESRSRILEKLSSLPDGTLPSGVKPALGPDATPLGQVFWYTLEGRDAQGNPAEGWDLGELRTIQDYQVKDALLAVDGVAEVASVGGFTQEYQVEVDPDALRHYGIELEQVVRAVANSNKDTGARSLEINRVEYVVRGEGSVNNEDDIAGSVVTVKDNVPVLISDVARVTLGPGLRRGVLDREGVEAVGGIVVARYGENPLEVIDGIKERIAELAPSLPMKNLPDGRQSHITVVAFYDRSGLIHETLGTLQEALSLEILLTILVVIILVRNLRAGLLVAMVLPLAVLICFIAMKVFSVDANIVALSGIAIAIGTMVDMGVILVENILRGLKKGDDRSVYQVVYDATREVSGAILTAVTTTVLGFLPVFTLTGAEGKLFRPLALTKTFALGASVLVALLVIPPAARLLMKQSRRESEPGKNRFLFHALVAGAAVVLLARQWLPLGPEHSFILNTVFVILLCGGILGIFMVFGRFYPQILGWCMAHKAPFLMLPILVIAAGGFVWKGLGKEFMPPLDEGSFLYMPTTMPHASIGEATEVLSILDKAIATIPEVDQVVGKLGRASTALDPAPISMVETVINYKPEYKLGQDGHRIRYKYNKDQDIFVRGDDGKLIPDNKGRFYRQWRDEIRTPDDIWDEIVRVTKLPGTTSAPKLQPISTRLVMLQSGMRAPMGIKLQGPDLASLEEAALAMEAVLKEVPSVKANTVVADRIVGKPYLEIVLDRPALALHGLTVAKVQNVIQTAIGGKTATVTVEGRQRNAVRVRYLRERRNDLESLQRIHVTAPGGEVVPLSELADLELVRGPMAIKSEDTFLLAYVVFDGVNSMAEVDIIEECRKHLEASRSNGKLQLPEGVSYSFAGSYENQVRSEQTLKLVLPVALLLIMLVLHLQFRSLSTTLMVFAGVFVAWAGGFIMVWFFGQPWFLDFHFFGVLMRDLFQVQTINLSVAVWVGFLALFGIATDDGVLMATYLDQEFRRKKAATRDEIRQLAVAAATRRVRPALMTSATTILALLPILTLNGRGAEIMIPMAIPSLGGMFMALLTLFTVPVLYAGRMEWRSKRRNNRVTTS